MNLSAPRSQPRGPGDGERAPVADDLNRAMRAAWGHFKQEMTERVAALGLSVLQARALRQLEAPMTMRALADAVGTEPSNLTAVVDRLESAGLVQRRSRPGDRRVRELALTRTGEATRQRVDLDVFGSMTIFDRLTPAEQSQLLGLLEKLASH